MTISSQNYFFRNYSHTDLENFLDFIKDCRLKDTVGSVPDPSHIRTHLVQPFSYPEKNIIFALSKNPQLKVGYLELIPEGFLNRAVITCLIHPYHRRRGLASKLLQLAEPMAAAQELNYIHANIEKENEAAKCFLLANGFAYIRTFLELIAHLSDICSDTNLSHSPNLTFRHLQPGEESVLTELQNKCFTGSWGFNPNTVEENYFRLHAPGASPANVIIAYHKDVPSAYCWTIPYSGQNTGRILMIGVHPDYRGLKLGRSIMLESFRYLHKIGRKKVELTVDANNSPAINLYYSLGFTRRTETYWYEKEIKL